MSEIDEHVASNVSGAPSKGRYDVQSVHRAVDVLLALASAPNPLSVSEVARIVGASKSTAYALLQTLGRRGLVDSQGEGFQRRYALGLTLARLGYIATQQVTVTDIALPYLHELTTLTQLSSRVAVYDLGHAVVVAQVDGPTAVRFNLNMGARERLHCSGIGKAILASFSDAEVRQLASKAGLPQHTARTHTTVVTLLADLAATRTRGYAIDDEEDADGIMCIGAALHDHTGLCTGAISVTGLRVSFPGDRATQVGEIVRASAAAMSARLGWTP
jgi:IclR family acetate operon transcriptional repressor